uniref:Nudix hydrolase domain-containing protein n=1 Tax=Arcella intermedia TaxID=1963864 RepID=A0A6B2LJ49_9EUKA
MHRIEDQFIILFKWISKESPAVPESGTHVAGACGMVIRPSPADPTKKQVLLMRERYRHYRWEFPVGAVERGEFFIQTAHKEVKEEVGLETKILGLVGIENDTNSRFGRNNVLMCFACKMVNERDEPVMDPEEVVEVAWVDLEELVKGGPDFILKSYPLSAVVVHFLKAYVESGFQLVEAKKIGYNYYYPPPPGHPYN